MSIKHGGSGKARQIDLGAQSSYGKFDTSFYFKRNTISQIIIVYFHNLVSQKRSIYPIKKE